MLLQDLPVAFSTAREQLLVIKPVFGQISVNKYMMLIIKYVNNVLITWIGRTEGELRDDISDE